VSLKYITGEQIRKGDRVLFHGEPGEIELVADPTIAGSEADWYVQEYCGGVTVLELQPKHFGRVFLPEPQTTDDLEFVARQA
jgi:hypothetical protein